jgi:hypothetical protein
MYPARAVSVISPASSSSWAGRGRPDWAQVQLHAPPERHWVAVRSDDRQDGSGGGVPDRGGELVVVQAGRRWVSRSIGAVEADDGVEVHQSAPLVFGDLGVGQPGVVAEL